MSIAVLVHTPWIRNTFKFVAALAIPAVICGAFYLAKTKADKEFGENQEMLKSKKDTGQMSVDNYELKEVDDSNQVKWELVAKKGVTTDHQKYEVKGVHVKYYDGPNVKMKVTAPSGRVDAQTRFVTLTSEKGERVRGEGEEGKSVFESETVELDKNNKFFATGGVIIEWTDSAKVTGNEARGKLDKGGLQEVKVIGHTHAVIAVK